MRWSVTAAVAGILLSIVAWRLVASSDEKRVTATILTEANVVRAHVPDSLDAPRKTLDQLSRHAAPDDAAWIAEAVRIRAAHPEFRAIARLDQRLVVPEGAALPDADGFRDGVFRISAPRVAAVIDIRPKLEAELAGRAPGLGILVTDNDVELYRRGGEPGEWKRSSTSTFDGVTRKLTIWPLPETLASLRSSLPLAVLGAGIALSLLLGVSIHFWRVAASLNITLEERVRRATASLVDAEARIRDLYEHAPDAFATVDRETGAIRECNATLAESTGFSKGDLVGKAVLDVVAPESLTAAREAFNAFRSDGEARDVALRLRRKDGGSLETSLNIARDRDGNANCSWRDMTRLRDVEDQLRQAQKMEAVGRLAGGIAHDFNNLLTVILGFAESASRTAPPDIRTALAEIRRAGERAADLAAKLLTFSRKRVVRPRVLDINAVVRSMESMLDRLLSERIELKVSLDAGLGPVMADDGQLEQVVMNLVVNARDAMPDGGRIYVETQNVELDAASGLRHEAELVQSGPYVLLAVTDTGTGMTAEVKARAFEPFFTTKEFGKGTGLGLATVYAIVKQWRGYIWIYSEPNRGTAVKIYLPRLKRTHPEAPATPPPIAPVGGRETVLVVEDEDAVRRLTVQLLQNAGYAVLQAANGEEALRVEGRIDVLLTDAVMPGIQGPDLAKHLKAARPDLAVVVMSGYTGAVALDRGFVEKDGLFLQKPFTNAELLRAVRNAVERRAKKT